MIAQQTRFRDLPPSLLAARLAKTAIEIEFGAAIVRVRSSLDIFVRDFQRIYGAFVVPERIPFADFHVEICAGRGLRTFLKPQSRFLIDGVQPFDPFPREQAFPAF
jgi:hypothetical protein